MDFLIRIFGFIKKHWGLAVISGGALAFETILDMVFPWLIKWTIDEAITHNDMALLQKILIGAGGIIIIKLFFAVVHRLCISRLVQKVIFDMRNALYDALQRLSFGFHDRSQSGQLMSRVTSDVENIHWFIRFGLLNAISIFIIVTSVTVIMFRMDPVLAACALSILPFIVFVVMRFSKRVGPIFMDVQKKVGYMTSLLQENIIGIKVVKAFTGEQAEYDRFTKSTWDIVDAQGKAILLRAQHIPALFFIISCGTVMILLVGGYRVMHGYITVGELVAFNSYFFMIAFPLRMIGHIVNVTQRSRAAGKRIFEILDEEQEIKERPSVITNISLAGDIVFRNITFNYAHNLPVLHTVNVHIKAGETVALVGPTGSGKSTLAGLIPRFYDPATGEILIDGHNIKDINVPALRQQIGLVFQETFLFSSSVAENIAYGRSDVTRAEIERCGKLAQIDDFVTLLPEGYDTVIGERGVDLSGGQKQRIAIARALLMDPRILIMDDATSSIDVDTEFLLQEALQTVFRNRTNIIIAHRFSSIKYAHRIIVMDKGSVVEQGTHRELLARKGLYDQIYRIQFAEEASSC